VGLGTRNLPTGVVTFLLTDIEASTRLWQQHEAVMDAVVARHEELIRRSVEAHGGHLLKARGEGDSTFSVFASARAGLAAAVAAQLALQAEPWSGGVTLATRAAVHTGEATLRDGDYFGTAVNRCARLRAIAHGGQVICSQATAELASDDLPAEVGLCDLGTHGLRDLSRPERVHQVEHPGLPRDFPPLRSLGATRSNLPAQRTSFVGRIDLLDEVRRHLEDHRLVTLTGVGGCGKTRLAVEVATSLLSRIDEVYFCDLSAVADADVVPTTVAAAVGVPSAGSLTPTTRRARDDLLEHLQDRQVVLVVDNCEHLLDECASLLDAVLDRCPGVRILATSREALEVQGERAVTVPSLSVPRGSDLACESVVLFCERAAATGASVDLTDDMAPHVAEICHRLDGIPLAIELAAALCSALTPRQIAERLSDRFRLLSGGRRRVQRQQTLAAMLDWSHDLLDEEDRRLLRWLAVFPQPFTLEQAEALAGPSLATPVAGALRRLISKSLLTTDGHRYRLLETVRLYAEQRLLDAGEAEAARDRHRDLIVEWVESFPDEDVFGSRAGASFVQDIDQIRAALRWSDDQGRLESIAAIMSRVVVGFSRDLQETGPWMLKALAAQGLSDDERLRLIAAAQWAAFCRLDLGVIPALGDEATRLPPDPTGIAYASAQAFSALYHSMTWYLLGVDGADDVARTYASAALAAASTPAALAFSANWLGLAHVGIGDLDAASQIFRAGAMTEREPDAVAGASWTMHGVVEQLLGHLDVALDAFERARAILENDAWSISTDFDSFWLVSSAPCLELAGRGQEAYDLLRRIVDRELETGVPATVAPIVLGCLGVVAALRDRPDVAVPLLVRGVEQPISPLDHLSFSPYLDHAVATLLSTGRSAAEVESLRAQGRGMSFEEATSLAFAALDG
jgi:predicted ATPase/class 3 adenylate cyclase